MTYSNSLAMGRQRYGDRARRSEAVILAARRWEKNQNTISFRSKGAAIGPVSNAIILVVLACLLGLLYLTQVTKTNALGYRLNELEQRHSGLAREQDELRVESARLQSLDRIKNSQPAQALVSAAPSATVRH